MVGPDSLDAVRRGSDIPSAVRAGYRRYVRGKVAFILVALAVLVAAVLVASTTGAVDIAFGDVLGVLLQGDRSGLGRIVWDVRMPRIVAAMLAGAGLSLAGTVMQSVLRNQLASPYTLGISSAAACGAAFAIVVLAAGTSSSSSIVITDPRIVTFSAFGFSMLATGIVLLLARLTRISAESMVLAGIAIGSVFAAGLTLMQYLADSVQLATIVAWTFGDLGRADWRMVGVIAVVLLPTWLLLGSFRWSLNALDAGEEVAKGLGVNAERIRVVSMVVASLLSAVIVSGLGIIAFVGLLGPHIARRVIGGDQRFLLIASPLVGAVVLLAADTVARSVLAPMVLPVGVLTSMLGGPLFVYLLLSRAGR